VPTARVLGSESDKSEPNDSWKRLSICSTLTVVLAAGLCQSKGALQPPEPTPVAEVRGPPRPNVPLP
jgi:hypothetical protein